LRQMDDRREIVVLGWWVQPFAELSQMQWARWEDTDKGERPSAQGSGLRA